MTTTVKVDGLAALRERIEAMQKDVHAAIGKALKAAVKQMGEDRLYQTTGVIEGTATREPEPD